MAVAVDSGFFATLPTLSQVPKDQADVAWLIYELQAGDDQGRYKLSHSQTVYTQFTSALQRITNADPGLENDFLKILQRKLDKKQMGGSNPPDASSLLDLFAQDEALEE